MADVFGALGSAIAAPMKMLGSVRQAYYDPQGQKQQSLDMQMAQQKMQMIGEFVKSNTYNPEQFAQAMNEIMPLLQQDPHIGKVLPKGLMEKDFSQYQELQKQDKAQSNLLGLQERVAQGVLPVGTANQMFTKNPMNVPRATGAPTETDPNVNPGFWAKPPQPAQKAFNVNKSMYEKDGKYFVRELNQNGELISEYPATEKDIKSSSTNVNVDMGVSKTTASQIEQKQLDLLNSRDALKNSMDKFEGSFATWYGKAAAKGVAVGEKVGLDKAIEMFGGDTTKAKQYLSDFTAWDSSVRTQFNEYRKYITGAAAGMPEIEYLKGATISDKDSTTQIVSKTKELLEMGQRVMNRNKIFMVMGLKSPADTVSIPSNALPKDYDLTDEQAKQIYNSYSKDNKQNVSEDKLNKLDPASKAQYEQILKSGDKEKIKAANDRINAMK